MKPLLGHDLPDQKVWDDPTAQEEHRQLFQHLCWLRAHPPETEIVIPATYDRLMDGTSTKTQVRVSPDARRDLTPDADRIVGLCLPSWEWLKAQPEGSLTRHPSLSMDGEGLVPYVFTGKPATLDVTLLGRAYGLSKALGDGASRALVDWLRLQVSWKNPSTGRFQLVRYKKGPGSIPDWLQRVLDTERKESAERWRETLRKFERDVKVTTERLDSLSDAHFRRVPVEQKVLLQFRRDLDHVRSWRSQSSWGRAR